MNELFIVSPKFTADNKKRVIFGTGSAGIMMLLKLIHKEVHVDYFCDTYDSKVGNRIMSKKVISFETLKQNKDEFNIVIASEAYEEISENLIALGFENIFIDIDHRNQGFIPNGYTMDRFIEPDQ